MKQVQIQAAEKAIALLKASGAQYKVIFDDGTEYGDLEVVTPKKRIRRTPHGVLTSMYKDPINTAEVGDVIQFPVADVAAIDIAPETLRSAATAYASMTWGNGSYTSTITDTHVEILRIS